MRWSAVSPSAWTRCSRPGSWTRCAVRSTGRSPRTPRGSTAWATVRWWPCSPGGCRNRGCGRRSSCRRAATRSGRRPGSDINYGTEDGGGGRGWFGCSTRWRRPKGSLRGSWIAGTPLRIPRPPAPVPVDMRIGITCYPTYGGSGAVATELGLELARRRHDVHFVSYASPFRLRGFAERVTFHEVTQLEYPLFEQSSPYALALAVKQHEVAKRES